MPNRYTALVISIPDSKGLEKLYCLIPVDMPAGYRCWDLRRRAGPRATKTHRVTRDDKGRCACTCQDATYRTDGKPCKHVAAVRAAGLLTPLTQQDKDEIARQRAQGRDGEPSTGRGAREAGATSERTPTGAK